VGSGLNRRRTIFDVVLEGLLYQQDFDVVDGQADYEVPINGRLMYEPMIG